LDERLSADTSHVEQFHDKIISNLMLANNMCGWDLINPESCLQSAHGKIKCMFIPKNATSLIQPLDNGLITAFKQVHGK